TSFVANAQIFVVQNDISQGLELNVFTIIQQMDFGQIAVAFVITVLVSGSTLVLSFLINEQKP
ncbi:MAG: hypothetical protein MUE54_10625, partial [Anaerolineae bacterium]|nr:hypothetical protein [Anaerolineae bacterium]